ncbi:aminotransferase class I/II-fold pyridoxal phosphate-dependent enzyme [Mycoplasmatota bacterium zrk1]
MKTNNNLSKIAFPMIRHFNIEAMKYDNIIKLTIGEPHFAPPKDIQKAAIFAIENNDYKYVLSEGRVDTKKSILNYVKKYFNQHYSMDEIMITVGSTEALSSTLAALLNPDDEVIIPTPAYTGYSPLVTLNNSVSVFMDTSIDDFQIRYNNLKKHITSKTRCLILNYPNNPTGVSLDSQSLEDIKKILKEHDIYIILDEIYNRIMIDDFKSIVDPSVKDKIIIINGLSKSHSLTGWRIGYVLASREIIQSIMKVHQYVVVAVNTITQYAATEIDCDISKRINYYKKNVDYAYNRLIKMGLNVVKPNGTYYIFPEVPYHSEKLFYDLLEKERVAIIPGTCFGDFKKHIRISCAVDFNILKEAMDRMERLIKSC